MGKINGCLKCLFVFFNVLFAILGCVLVFGMVRVSIFSQQLSSVGGPSLGWGWVFAIGVLVISFLGICAGCSEKDLILKIFAGFMGLGMIIMLICGIIAVVTRNKIKNNFDSTSAELAKTFMADDQMKGMLEALQDGFMCCGVVSSGDWDDQIPNSCECKDQYRGGYGGFGHSTGCKSKPTGVTGPEQIYKQSCGEVILYLINFFFQIIMGFFFGFAVTALLGLLVSILMIHQVKRHDRAGGSSMAMKSY